MVDEKQNNAGGRVLDEIVKNISEKSYPPVHLWNPEFCGDINMTILKDGSWHYMNSPINRPEMVRLFSTVLRKDHDEYFLVTPVEKLSIKVEDAPFFVVGLEVKGQGQEQALIFETLTDDQVIADKDHPIKVVENKTTGEPSPYIHIRNGMDARINRAVFYELVELAVPMSSDENTLGVWSGGEFFPLGQLAVAESGE